jgi:hydroxyethylthiazole kinase-like sugar kinase family protein
LLGKIGSGCALGSTVTSYFAVHKKDKLLAVLAAILHYEIAAERIVRPRNVHTRVPGPALRYRAGGGEG